ncbi:MAG: hypothetical protein HeimC3_02450 [Candidatus Heimdallarchaeota archaeon LC_3]|nr:MAG: hypothetical protein HeimC3_49520 [Candidatus Heimdallarchaeota archaeon LC_3]OLS27668.1 MAG: hypothetical protein HeimC3_02450 [Candidatus Heimdallarchaeota archaeon LC_3]
MDKLISQELLNLIVNFNNLKYLNKILKQIDIKDISSKEFQILYLISNYEPCNLTKISEIVQYPNSTVCRIIDKLNEAKLIKKHDSKNNSDRRKKKLSPTEKGEKIINIFIKQHIKISTFIVGDIPNQNLALVLEKLKKFFSHF